MFDYIRCRMPLPADPPPPAIEWFQTKDTDSQYLDKYTIEADGRLIFHKVERARTEDPTHPLGFWMKPVKEEDVEVPFHGDLEFCHYSADTRDWWSYTARFTEGRCVRIWLVEHKIVEPANG